ncbi:MAG: Cna B-type domain-containing protein [Eubacteriales bacterium]|nr:Cna B-type domain-containing protein [Eubacteriales bacterium]
MAKMESERPEQISFHATRPGFDFSAVLNASNNWATSIDLDRYDKGGDEVTYTLSAYASENAPYTISASGNLDDGFTIVATKLDTYTIPVSIVWEDEGQVDLRPAEVAVRPTPVLPNSSSVTLSPENNWKASLHCFKKDSANNDILYTGVETFIKIPGYEPEEDAKYNRYTFTVNKGGNLEKGYTITARLKPAPPSTTTSTTFTPSATTPTNTTDVKSDPAKTSRTTAGYNPKTTHSRLPVTGEIATSINLLFPTLLFAITGLKFKLSRKD